jgi:hypothetical protein
MTSSAPTATTLRLPTRSRAVPTSTRLRTRRVPTLVAPVVALLLAVGVVVGAQATGYWATSGRDVLAGAAAEDGAGSAVGSGSAEVDGAALPAVPDDVKGWMTLGQVLSAEFPGVTEAGLRQAFAIPASVGLDTTLKDLDGTVPDFDVAALRVWLGSPG